MYFGTCALSYLKHTSTLCCTCFILLSTLWLNIERMASSLHTAFTPMLKGDKLWHRHYIPGLTFQTSIYVNRRINLNHLPGAFAYFPTIQILQAENKSTLPTNTPVWAPTTSRFLLLLRVAKSCSLILGVTNVKLLIWMVGCVITIILCFPELNRDAASWTCLAVNQKGGELY